MALAHFWMQSISRAKANLPASVAVHYLKREAEFAAEAYLSRTSERTKDRHDLVAWGVQHLPAWAEDSPGTFFRAAEQYEGANRYHAVMLQFSLPKEMTHAQHLALTHDFIEATMSDKTLLWVKHEPLDTFTHEPQPHIHMLLSARTVDGIARDEQQTFQRWNREEPARGGCEKDLFWSRRQAVEQLRHAFTDLTNFHAEKLGLDMRIDSRSLRRRDIDRKPMYKEEDRPNRVVLEAEQHKAAQAWEQRKVYKGLGEVQAIPREEFVLLVRQWTRDYDRGQQLPRVSLTEVQAWTTEEQTRLAQRQQGVDHQLAQVERGLAGELRAHELLALTPRPRQEEPVTPGLRARIFEDDHPGYRY
jgi:hypothetical protein